MSRAGWLVGLLAILALAANYMGTFTEPHNAARAAEDPTDLRKRIETLEARVAILEEQLARVPRTIRLPAASWPAEPKHWNKREFNGAPVYIIPLGGDDSKK